MGSDLVSRSWKVYKTSKFRFESLSRTDRFVSSVGRASHYFLLSNLFDFNPGPDSVKLEDMGEALDSVSHVEVTADCRAKVHREKGVRCWVYARTVGTIERHPESCDRCVEAIQ